jgi:transcriptional regulator
VSWPADFAAEHAWYVTTADRICTPRQLQVLQGRAAHLTFDEIGAWLGTTRQAAHETHRRAEQRLLRAHQEEAAA